MKLPLLISVPHAGRSVPPEVQTACRLSEAQIIADGDEGAAEIYALQDEVTHFVTTDIARAIVDLNRREDDRRPDGVVKTHTCFNEVVYEPFPPEEVIETLLQRYYRPYHARLRQCADPGVVLGVDCHTMLAEGPPIGPGPGIARPALCLSNADGTCPEDWLASLGRALQRSYELEVSINTPFRGGYIIRCHAREMPWVQLELSRAAFMSNHDKRARLLSALRSWVAEFSAA